MILNERSFSKRETWAAILLVSCGFGHKMKFVGHKVKFRRGLGFFIAELWASAMGEEFIIETWD
jgi:hypothetical protein